MRRAARPRKNARDLTIYHLGQLRCSYDFFGKAFGDTLEALDEMRASWSDPNVQQRVRDASKRFGPNFKPWAQIAFDELNIFGEDGLEESRQVYREQRVGRQGSA